MIDDEGFHQFPLCVDLDGTLWSGDCLFLAIKEFIKKHPLKFFKIFKWWATDITILKSKVMEEIYFPVQKITFYPQVLGFLNEMIFKGADVYLITGSDQVIADIVYRHLKIFKEAFGSANGINLVGKNKANFLNKRFGRHQYIYFGNEWKDRFIWQDSAAAVAVNVPLKAKKWLEQSGIYTKHFKC